MLWLGILVLRGREKKRILMFFSLRSVFVLGLIILLISLCQLPPWVFILIPHGLFNGIMLPRNNNIMVGLSPPVLQLLLPPPPPTSLGEASGSQQECTGSEQPKSLRSRLIKMFKSPTRGDNYTIPQALVGVDMIILFVATTSGVGTTLTAIDNMGQIGKALGYTLVNISTFISLITIWNFLVAGFLSEYLLHKYKFPRPLIFTMILLIVCVGHVFISYALPGSLYVASVIIGLSLRTHLAKFLRSFPVSVLLVINTKWGKTEIKVPKHLHCCGYLDLKKASLLTRNVAKGRWFVVFLCFLIMSTAQGTSMRGIYPETQSVQTISEIYINQYAPVVHLGHGDTETVVHSSVGVLNVEKYKATGDGKHSTQRSVTTMGKVVKDRRLLKQGKSKPTKPEMNKGAPAQHN